MPISAEGAALGFELGAAVGQTSIAPREAAIAVLATGFAHKAPAAWLVNVREARNAGLEDNHIAAIARGIPGAIRARIPLRMAVRGRYVLIYP